MGLSFAPPVRMAARRRCSVIRVVPPTAGLQRRARAAPDRWGCR
jgi:hypothetical protein